MGVAAIDLRGFGVSIGTRPILADVTLAVESGEVLALVGASGAGKTALVRALLGLLPPTAHVTGHLGLAGHDLSRAAEPDWRALRGRTVALVPQDPQTALAAHRTVGGLLHEAVAVAAGAPRGAERRARVAALLRSVGLDPAWAARYPHQLSGGQGQRALVALALAADPVVILADEPTSALDPVAAVAVLERLRDEAASRGRAVVLVSHDLAAAARWADRVAVLAAGRVVEWGPAATVLQAPSHPYVQGLLAARPGGVPQPEVDLPIAPVAGPCAPAQAGCTFAMTCPRATAACRGRAPALRPLGRTAVACHAVGSP